jgi:hypothetical protein
MNESMLFRQVYKKEESKKCVIPCYSKFRLRFDIIVILLSIYNCIMIPIEISMGKNVFGDKEKIIY